MSKTVSVLGAGIQGVCVSLMLQKHGYQVALIDQSRDIINRASLTYEGKIHLGFVYGMDRSLKTGHKMVEDALRFAPYLDYLLDKKEDWSLIKSKPNIYLVARDSMLSAQEIESHFEKLDVHFQQCLADEGLHYLGERPGSLFRKIAIPGYINPAAVGAAFLTREVSVNQVALKELLKRKLLQLPSIRVFLDHRVTGIAADAGGFAVQCRKKDGSTASFGSDAVFNCTWESRTHFDRMMGIGDEAGQSIRFKYGLVLKADDFLRSLDSFTLVHGPYGNVVVNAHDDRAFCSWYPSCMKGMMDYGPVPESWDRACEGHISDSTIASLREDNFAEFRKIVPRWGDLEVLQVTAGLILAGGNKDITERDSSFHSRSEFPIRRSGDYFSVSTSKYTSAPRNTLLLEKMLFN
jgi:glycine/D-amino acid oxidase-like deaminating enzyme